MGRILKRVSAGLAVAAAIALVVLLTDLVERLLDGMMARLGSVWTLGVLTVATVGLGALWLRYGGARVLRRWGLILKPLPENARSSADADADSDPELVGPR